MTKFYIKLDEIEFTTKKSATEYVKQILGAYRPGDRVEVAVHQSVLWDLLTNHPHAEQKFGVGVDHFAVMRTEFGNNCFELVREDGTRTDFSYVECLKPSSPEKKAIDAFRHAVESQVIAFKDLVFNGAESVPCAATGELVTKRNCHVDHIVPFRQIVEEFLNHFELKLSDIETEPTRDGEVKTQLVDKEILAAWVEFHQERAQLRVVTKNFNMSRPRA